MSSNNKLILISFSVLGMPMEHPFHTYQPGNVNEKITEPSFCIINKGEDGIWTVDHVIYTQANSEMIIQHDNTTSPLVLSSPNSRNDNGVTYYTIPFENGIYTQWVESQSYLGYLNEMIDKMVIDKSHHIYHVEYLFYRLRKMISYIEKGQRIPVEVHHLPHLTIPKSRYTEFSAYYKLHGGSRRWGQAFCDYMESQKCTQDRSWWDRLYYAEDDYAKAMVKERLDHDH